MTEVERSSPQEGNKVNVLGVRVDRVTTPDVLEKVNEYIAEGGKKTIMYANVHVINQAQSDPDLMEILNRADLVYPDGHGVVLGARLTGKDLPPRMTGADWIHDLCRFAEERNFTLYIVAGDPGLAEEARKELGNRYNSLRILGTYDGFFHKRGETGKLIEDINSKKPHIVLIGMGTPIQEKFTDSSRSSIEAPVCWVVGALFDFVAGKARRGPRWMLDNGMEWLCRLYFEPRRLWKRYILGNSLFLIRILYLRARKGK
jgi:N-acetylglucosaminyldiphosphoundecaprenol N-acetyl-beta-D-mannosaminyltransferase